MKLIWKNIERKAMKGIMIIGIMASATLMSCGNQGGADGMGSGATNDAEVEDNMPDIRTDSENENPNGIGTREDMEMTTDTTSNIDNGGTSSKGSGSGVNDRMGTERNGTEAGNTDTNTDMNTGDINTGNPDSGTGKGTATGSDNTKSRIESTKKGSNSGPGTGNQQ
jgi:hypothetical protein